MTLPPILNPVLSVLAGDSRVSAVWLGGSHARGEADEYSDIDLCLEASDWNPTALGGLWLAGQSHPLAGSPFFHGILSDGTILDVLVRSPYDGYIALPLPEGTTPPAGRAEPNGLATEFWINTFKHRKVIGRGLWPMSSLGMHHERLLLIRMWAQAAIGEDPGPTSMSIHGMTPFFRQYVNSHQAEVLGLPCRTFDEMRVSIERMREEASRVGKMARERWGVPYPQRLESLVRAASLPNT